MDLGHARRDYLRWLAVTRNLSLHTLRAYASDLEVLERDMGHASPDPLSPDALLDFLERQRTSGLCASTIRRRACSIRGYCAWLVEEDLLASNPWDAIRLNLRRERPLPRLVPSHELRLLLALLSTEAGLDQSKGVLFTDERAGPATTLLSVVLMIATGARVGELVAVLDCDIDIPNRQLRVHGKGSRDRQVYLSNDWVSGLVESYFDLRARLGITQATLLFNRHSHPMTTSALRARVAAAGARAGLGRRVTPHMLRHSAATELLEAGVDIRYVQRLLGHASVSTTEIYTHVTDRALRRVVTQADVLGRTLRAS
jgi:integrase/recombinase XerD